MSRSLAVITRGIRAAHVDLSRVDAELAEAEAAEAELRSMLERARGDLDVARAREAAARGREPQQLRLQLGTVQP